MKIPDGFTLPAGAQSAYDISLQRALVPLLRAVAVKVNQIGDGLAIGQDNLRTAAPLSGAWQAGDEVRNSVPAELGAIGSKYVIRGWQCIVSGTPGTWVQQRYLTGN